MCDEVGGDGEPVPDGLLGEVEDEPGVPGPPGLLALDDGELCGGLELLDALDVLDVLGLLGVPGLDDDGLDDDGPDELDELPGVVGGLPELLGGPGLPLPLSATICPLGSKRTCACHGVLGSAAWSTVMRIVVCAPGARMPETALSRSQGTSAEAAQETGAVPEFHRVTVTSPGTFDRCATLMFSCPVPALEVGPGHVLPIAEGSEFIGPPNGGPPPGPDAGDDADGVAGSTAATTWAVMMSPGSAAPGRPDPTAFRPPAIGSAGPASEPVLGRG